MIEHGCRGRRRLAPTEAAENRTNKVEQTTYRDEKLRTTLELLPELVAKGGPWFDLTFEVFGVPSLFSFGGTQRM